MTRAEEKTYGGCKDDADAGSWAVRQNKVRLWKIQAVVETEYGSEGYGEDRLMDSSCTTDCNNVVTVRSVFELGSFGSGESITRAADVGSSGISEV